MKKNLQGDSGEKVSIFGDIGHCEKRIHINVHLILNIYRNRVVFVFPVTSALDICWWVWMKREIYERKLARTVVAAVHIKKGEDQFRRRTRSHCVRAANYIDVSRGIFKRLF
jgi:hypothetical protein